MRKNTPRSVQGGNSREKSPERLVLGVITFLNNHEKGFLRKGYFTRAMLREETRAFQKRIIRKLSKLERSLRVRLKGLLCGNVLRDLIRSLDALIQTRFNPRFYVVGLRSLFLPCFLSRLLEEKAA